ncbi:MAG: tRNA dihydrouridine synthase DusB [Candidatus Woesearchaeota archaeon]
MATLPNFHSKAFLAPMAGITDTALRVLCKELGAGLVVIPLISIHSIIAKEKEIKEFIEYSEKERPRAIQLFGSDIKLLEKAVKIVSPYFDIIDYNMGCPAPHVTQQMACSALLQKPELTRKIFQTMVKATDKPVTVKIRSGIDKPDKFLEIGKIAEEEGIAMITLHPRTVKQGYSGQADWSLIKKLKQHVKIPVCGNGDIQTPEDAKRMLIETGCDYVMIGRAAVSNPYLFKQIIAYLKMGNYPKLKVKAKLNLFFKYLNHAQNNNIKPSQIRINAMNFSKGCKDARRLRGNLLGKNTVEEIRAVVQKFYDSLG